MLDFFHSVIGKIAVGISSVALFFSVGVTPAGTRPAINNTISAPTHIAITQSTTSQPGNRLGSESQSGLKQLPSASSPVTKIDTPSNQTESVIDRAPLDAAINDVKSLLQNAAQMLADYRTSEKGLSRLRSENLSKLITVVDAVPELSAASHLLKEYKNSIAQLDYLMTSEAVIEYSRAVVSASEYENALEELRRQIQASPASRSPSIDPEAVKAILDTHRKTMFALQMNFANAFDITYAESKNIQKPLREM